MTESPPLWVPHPARQAGTKPQWSVTEKAFEDNRLKAKLSEMHQPALPNDPPQSVPKNDLAHADTSHEQKRGLNMIST